MKKSARGFTLIELIVTVTIGLILVASSLVAYRGMGEKESVKQEGISFQTNLRSFQQKAVATEKPVGCEGFFQGYRVVVDADLDKYSVTAECATSNGDTTDFELSNGVEFSGAFSDIIFYPLSAELLGAQTITLLSQDGSYTYQVIIEEAGVIRGGLL